MSLIIPVVHRLNTSLTGEFMANCLQRTRKERVRNIFGILMKQNGISQRRQQADLVGYYGA